MRNPQLYLSSLLLATVACADGGDRPSREGSPAQDAIVRDSAGIRIIESSTPVWDGDGWSVSDTPSVVIGRREGDERYLFGLIGGAVVLGDGRIAVLDRLAAVIRVYSPEGIHIEDWGRTGEGPGEFTAAEGLFPYRGDSVLVSGSLARRFHIFDHAGRFGRRAAPQMSSPPPIPPTSPHSSGSTSTRKGTSGRVSGGTEQARMESEGPGSGRGDGRTRSEPSVIEERTSVLSATLGH